MLVALEDPDGETLRVPVLRVFDGDGFLTRLRYRAPQVEHEVAVRFGFIDAPEMEQPGGREARTFLCSLIAGRWLDLAILLKQDTASIFDRHGRLVCVPYLTDTTGEWAGRSRNIELEMVLNGWAWVLERYGPSEHYLDALSDARHHRRGIWARGNNVHPWEFKRALYRQRRSSPPRQGNLFAD